MKIWPIITAVFIMLCLASGLTIERLTKERDAALTEVSLLQSALFQSEVENTALKDVITIERLRFTMTIAGMEKNLKDSQNLATEWLRRANVIHSSFVINYQTLGDSLRGANQKLLFEMGEFLAFEHTALRESIRQLGVGQ